MPVLRDLMGAVTRSLPRVKGNGYLCRTLCHRVYKAKDSDLVTVRFRDGSRMRLDLASRTEELAFWLGEYNGDVIQRLATCLTPGCVVLDIGANVGFYSIALGLRMARAGGSLFAFEPVPSNYARLQEHVAMNGLEKTVVPISLGLGERDGEVPFHLENADRATTGNAVILEGNAEPIEANTRGRIARLDDVAARQGITSCCLIKIDVEGAELMVFRGGMEFLTRHRPIIYAEFNAYWLDRFGHSLMDIVDLLRPLGYRYYRQVGKASFVPVERMKNGLEDLLLVPPDCPEATLRGLGVVTAARV